MALVFYYKKNPFSGTGVVRDSNEIICLFEPSLLCLGREGAACMCSTFQSHDHKTSLGQPSYVRKMSGLILGNRQGGKGM